MICVCSAIFFNILTFVPFVSHGISSPFSLSSSSHYWFTSCAGQQENLQSSWLQPQRAGRRDERNAGVIQMLGRKQKEKDVPQTGETGNGSDEQDIEGSRKRPSALVPAHLQE